MKIYTVEFESADDTDTVVSAISDLTTVSGPVSIISERPAERSGMVAQHAPSGSGCSDRPIDQIDKDTLTEIGGISKIGPQ